MHFCANDTWAFCEYAACDDIDSFAISFIIRLLFLIIVL